MVETSIRFKNRQEAGVKLAAALQEYRNDPDAIVIALPRGGVVVGGAVAESLHIPIDIVSPRKIGAPDNPEFAIGAITETGEGIFSTETIRMLGITREYLERAIAKEKDEATKRLHRYRKNRPPRNLKGKKVLLIDDGIATGSTLFAAIKTIKTESPKKLVVAVPVAPIEVLPSIKSQVDQVVILATPSPFFSVSQFYEVFDQTTDEEVISILNK